MSNKKPKTSTKYEEQDPTYEPDSHLDDSTKPHHAKRANRANCKNLVQQEILPPPYLLLNKNRFLMKQLDSLNSHFWVNHFWMNQVTMTYCQLLPM